jgi:inositol phosphorylceramide mannosyltransferase catalytic subunit
MGSAPHHPFLDRVLDHLQRYAHSWILPYLTVMLSTGPLFLSAMWKEHIWSHPKKGAEVSVLMPNWYFPHFASVVYCRFDEDDTRFFSSFGGSSWHRADVAFIFWVLQGVRSLLI